MNEKLERDSTPEPLDEAAGIAEALVEVAREHRAIYASRPSGPTNTAVVRALDNLIIALAARASLLCPGSEARAFTREPEGRC